VFADVGALLRLAFVHQFELELLALGDGIVAFDLLLTSRRLGLLVVAPLVGPR